jgi:hypothetical protein
MECQEYIPISSLVLFTRRKGKATREKRSNPDNGHCPDLIVSARQRKLCHQLESIFHHGLNNGIDHEEKTLSFQRYTSTFLPQDPKTSLPTSSSYLEGQDFPATSKCGNTRYVFFLEYTRLPFLRFQSRRLGRLLQLECNKGDGLDHLSNRLVPIPVHIKLVLWPLTRHSGPTPHERGLAILVKVDAHDEMEDASRQVQGRATTEGASELARALSLSPSFSSLQ